MLENIKLGIVIVMVLILILQIILATKGELEKSIICMLIIQILNLINVCILR